MSYRACKSPPHFCRKERNGDFLFLGRANVAERHGTPGVTIHVPLEGAFLVETEEGCRETRSGTVVSPGVEHRVHCGGQRRAIVSIDSLSLAGLTLRQWIGRESVAELPDSASRWLRPPLSRLCERPSAEGAEQAVGDLIPRLAPGVEPRRVDERVLAVVSRLHEGCGDAPTAAQLAESVQLSYDWFAHLFRREVGVSLASYRQLVKLRAALRIFFAGRSLTFAAHEAGFSDLPHFSRTCRKLFCVPPSYLAGARRFWPARPSRSSRRS